MKKVVGFIIVGLLGFNVAYGAESKLETYAKSPRISGLYVKVDDGKVLYEYTKGKGVPIGITKVRNPESLSDKTFRYEFGVNQPLVISFQDFNPLKYAVKVESKDEKTDINDPGPFFEILSTYKSIFVGKAGGETAVKSFTTFKDQEKFVAGETKCEAFFKNFDKLANAINYKVIEKVDDQEKEVSKLSEISVTENTLEKWQTGATSAKGIEDEIKEIDGITKKLDENVKAIKAAIKVVQGVDDKEKCTSIPLNVLAQSSYIMTQAYEAITRREAASTNLKELSKYLAKYRDKTSWNGNYYQFGSVPSPANQNLRKVTITVKQMDISVTDDKVTIKESEKNTVSSTFAVYKNESISVEPSIGFVYSPLKSNKFSTKTVNGNQVVEKTENSDDHHAAAFLNVYYTEWIKEKVYPFWQFGLSTAKDYPAILTGFGMKIRDTSFAFSVGAAFGFTKGLDKLSEGQTVSGQADIDKDEKTVIKPSWYLSLQYNF